MSTENINISDKQICETPEAIFLEINKGNWDSKIRQAIETMSGHPLKESNIEMREQFLDDPNIAKGLQDYFLNGRIDFPVEKWEGFIALLESNKSEKNIRSDLEAYMKQKVANVIGGHSKFTTQEKEQLGLLNSSEELDAYIKALHPDKEKKFLIFEALRKQKKYAYISEKIIENESLRKLLMEELKKIKITTTESITKSIEEVLPNNVTNILTDKRFQPFQTMIMDAVEIKTERGLKEILTPELIESEAFRKVMRIGAAALFPNS